MAVASVGRNCPYYDKNTEIYDCEDERLLEICGIRIKLLAQIGNGEEQAEACPLLSLDKDESKGELSNPELCVATPQQGPSSSAGSGAPPVSEEDDRPDPDARGSEEGAEKVEIEI